MNNQLILVILLNLIIASNASTIVKCNQPTSVSFCTQACGCSCPPNEENSISCSMNPITCPQSMEETCIETCFCSMDTTPDPTTILCEEPVKTSFCEQACGCGCDDAGSVNCLTEEGTCTNDAAQTCEAACSCKIGQISHGMKKKGPSKQVVLERVNYH